MTHAQFARSGVATINGAQLYYEIAGSGPAVALLHFGLGDARSWDEQFGVFAPRYTVLRYDARGFGRSSMPPGEYSPRADLDVLLDALGIEKAALVGVSMGGSLAIDYTLEHPERVSALVAVAPGLSGLEPSEADRVNAERYFGPIKQAIEAGDIARANELETRLWVVGPHRALERVPVGVFEKVREMNLRTFERQEEYNRGKAVPLNPPAAGRLHEIHTPTLVVIGDEDLPESQMLVDYLAATIPGARKVVLHDTAHAPHMEKPEEFNRVVLDFLGQVL